MVDHTNFFFRVLGEILVYYAHAAVTRLLQLTVVLSCCAELITLVSEVGYKPKEGKQLSCVPWLSVLFKRYPNRRVCAC